MLKRVMVLTVLLSSSCVLHRQTDSCGAVSPEIVCECLNPDNDPEVMKEWKKIEDRLHAHGITIHMIGSLGVDVVTDPQQADDARAIISKMIRTGEVDAKLLQLNIIEHQRTKGH